MTAFTEQELGRASLDAAEMRYLRTGAGIPVVLLHTLRTQLEYFRPLLAQLDSNGFEVIAPDLPGHGESSAPRVDYTAEFFTGAVEELLEHLDVREAIVGGESIGACIALALAARGNPRIAQVIALNPYDYGRWGGIRRSSPLANLVFGAMLVPLLGEVVARAGTKAILRRILAGGLHDPRALPGDLVDELYRCGSLPGHARALRSLTVNSRSWIDARASYGQIEVPVTLVYADHDWSCQAERDANAAAIPGARTLTLTECSHFSCLEKAPEIAQLVSSLPRP